MVSRVQKGEGIFEVPIRAKREKNKRLLMNSVMPVSHVGLNGNRDVTD